jgi:predicted negative regulator of RcsB-dependent stress response
MAYDLEEQEQLATFKAFWNQYGNLISWVVIIGLAGYAGYAWWNNHQRTQSAQASGLYDQVQKSVTAKDNAKVQLIAADVESKFGSTSYAQMAAMVAAKSAFDANDLKAAKAQLQWVIDNGNDEYKSIARLRMSGVLLDEKAYDQALKVIDSGTQPQFASAVLDRKGDIYAVQNKLMEARKSYQAALDALDKKAPGRQLIQLKLDAAGGAPVAAPAAPAASKAGA